MTTNKEKEWNNTFRHHSQFANEFFSFHPITTLDPHKIPLYYIFGMHQSQEILFHYLHQFVILLHILRKVFHIHIYNLSLCNLFLVKTTNMNDCFLFTTPTQHYFFHCGYGYHIYIAGFQDCIFKHKSHPLHLTSFPSHPHFFSTIGQESLSFLNSKSKKCRHFKTLLSHLSSPMCEWLNVGMLRHIILLVETSSSSSSWERETLETEIRKMYDIFVKEFELFRKQFVNEKNVLTLFEEWMEHLVLFKKDFFKNPETTINILRNIFYQSMIDHKYNHISFKSFDLSRMITSLYLWSLHYSHYLSQYVPLCYDSQTDETILMACLELFLTKDTILHKNQHQSIIIHHYDFSSSNYSNMPTTYSHVLNLLYDVHPSLRPSVLFSHLSKVI